MKASSFRFIISLAVAVITTVGASAAPKVIPGGTFAAPYVINQPGSYVLGGNRLMSDASKNVIEILAPDVTLDLGGFTLAHPGGSSGQGNGIYIPDTENVEIRNGSIVNSAEWAIGALIGKGLRVIGVRATGADHVAIISQAAATVIDRCVISDAGSGGIIAVGAGSLVTDCTINDCGSVGVRFTNTSRVVRTIVSGGQTGIDLRGSSTAVDCSVTGATQRGFYLEAHSTLRNVEAMTNALGVYSVHNSVVLIGSRISKNTTNIQGYYTSGGGNVIQ